MQTILDVDLPHHFWASLAEAQCAAQREAANTGGAVICVDAIDITPRSVRFIGSIPNAAVDRTMKPGTKSPMVGTFHTTWGAVLNPDEHVGFLVVQHPISIELCSPEMDDLVRIEVAISRKYDSVPVTVLGHMCCRRCKKPISAERLRARPGTHLCTDCQMKTEEERNGNHCACR